MTGKLRNRFSIGLSGVLVALVVAAAPAACESIEAALPQGQIELGAVDPDGVSLASVTVPMVFPVLGKCSWSDTFLAPRGGGARRHLGQDIMAPKMRPIVAVFDGVVYTRTGNHNTLTILGDNDWTAVYMHINNDTPGTDDGLGSSRFAFAPGLTSGSRVRAGQMVAWVGDSGNAEGTSPHLHFELHSSSRDAVVNPASSLRAAQRVASALPAQPERPVYRDSNGLGAGDIRVSGTVTEVDPAAMTLTLSVDTIVLPGHQSLSLSPARRKIVSVSAETQVRHSSDATIAISLSEVRAGTRAAAIGPDRGVGSVLAATQVVVGIEGRPEIDETPSVGGAHASATQRSPLSADEQRGVALLNADRAAQGLSALQADALLAAVARAHAEDMADQDYMNHTNKQGKSPGDRLKLAGIEWSSWAENIAINGSIEAAQRSWMQSPGHRGNILSSSNTHVGVGLARNSAGQLYAVQLFAKAGNLARARAASAR